jgi:uncharacterized Tic20 family protein
MSTDPTTSPPPAEDAGPSQDDRNMAMIAHASGMVPFVGLAVTGVLFNMKKDASPFVKDHIKEALNFDISLTPFDLVALLVLIFVGGIGLLLWIPFIGAHLGLGIMGSMAAAEGKPYRYVVNARLLK